jgi:hypothetical protein
MKVEGFIQCVLSNDYDYVNYAVPLVKTFEPNGRGEVIDFNKTNLSLVDSPILKRWVEDTREGVHKRVFFSILLGSAQIE